MPTITFTEDEYLALKPVFVYSGCALYAKLQPDVPIEITPEEALEALHRLRHVGARIPACVDVPRPTYFDKLQAVAGEDYGR